MACASQDSKFQKNNAATEYWQPPCARYCKHARREKGLGVRRVNLVAPPLCCKPWRRPSACLGRLRVEVAGVVPDGRGLGEVVEHEGVPRTLVRSAHACTLHRCEGRALCRDLFVPACAAARTEERCEGGFFGCGCLCVASRRDASTNTKLDPVDLLACQVATSAARAPPAAVGIGPNPLMLAAAMRPPPTSGVEVLQRQAVEIELFVQPGHEALHVAWLHAPKQPDTLTAREERHGGLCGARPHAIPHGRPPCPPGSAHLPEARTQKALQSVHRDKQCCEGRCRCSPACEPVRACASASQHLTYVIHAIKKQRLNRGQVELCGPIKGGGGGGGRVTCWQAWQDAHFLYLLVTPLSHTPALTALNAAGN